MTIRKTIWLTAIIILPIFSAHAQHFDWVKTYSGQDPAGRSWNYIASSVTDSHGNLYVAGQFAYGASIDGQSLLSFSPHGGDINNPNACIMKISPQGNIVWKKILHANYGGASQIYELQLVGDSALYANASIRPPSSSDEYLYFYDTLITQSNIGNILYADSLYYNGITSAISVFDLDGTLNENYILHMAYKDSDGRLITQDRVTSNDFDSVYIANQQFKPGPFRVDSHGNIYMGHISSDMITLYCDTCESLIRYDLQNGKIGEIVIMVNGRQRFFDAPITHPSTFNYRIMKFAPKFSNLLACRYIFENEIGRWGYTYNTQITSGPNDNIYMLCNLASPTALTTENLNGDTSLSVLLNGIVQGLLIEYDSTLSPQDVYQIIPQQSTYERTMWDLSLNKIVVEPDSNLLFILGTIAKNNDNFNTQINGQNIDIGSHNAFFLKYNIGDNLIRTTGKARTDYSTYLITDKLTTGAVASKGRLFASTSYKHDIQWKDTSITLVNGQEGTGVFIWSYSGEEIGYIDMNKSSLNNVLSTSLAIHDSSLYICGGLVDDIHIADTTITKTGNSIAYMAKYIDTAFMTPYVHTEEPGEVSITLVKDGAALVAYPNPFRQSVRIKVQGGQLKEHNGTVTAILTDLSGRREEVRLVPSGERKTESGERVYTLDLSGRPQATYLLTLTTADGKQHTVRLLKQSDIFSR